MYIALAESWNLMGGYAGYISFAHVTFFSVGAYTTAVCMKEFGISPFITACLGGFIAGVLALIVGFPILKLKGAYFAIGSILLAIIMQLVFLNWNLVGASTGLWYKLLPVSIETNRIIFYEVMFVLAAVITFVIRWIENSKFGLGIFTIREDEDVAKTIGINTAWLKMKGFMLGAFFAGVTGGIYGYYMSYVHPEITFSINISLLILLICFFGGSFTWSGPLLGAVILSLMNQLISTFIGDEISRIIFGFLLVVVIIFMPDGIIEYLKTLRAGTNRRPRE
jgi:branched-chain amino acid transport system permease protein